MRKSLHLFAAIFSLACVLALQVQAQDAKKDEKSTKLQDVLEFTIETDDLQNQTNLKDALNTLFEIGLARGKTVPIVVNSQAFRELAEKEIMEMRIQLPQVPRRMKIATVLKLILKQIDVPSGYLIREEFIEILPIELTRIVALMKEPIRADFDEKPFREVITQLADQTGATIVFDPRQKENGLDMPVTARFRNDATLKDAVFLLSDMVGLRPVVLRNSIYITSVDNAKDLEEELQRQEEKEAKDPLRDPAASR